MDRSVIRAVLALGLALLTVSALAAAFPTSVATGGDSLSTPNPDEVEGEAGPICFWSVQGPGCVRGSIEMEAAGSGPEGSLRALLSGPTSEERARGLWSAIPEGTALEDVEDRPEGTVIVRLEVPSAALRDLSHARFEIIVQQIGKTLEPRGWRELRIQTRDPDTGVFVPLARFLPEIPPPRKETTPMEGPRTASVGQPPAPGQGRPRGALSGKTVYVSAGHGWEWVCDAWWAPDDCTSDRWHTQRPPYPGPPYDEGPIIEDHNNAEAVDQYLLRYLWNAGAMVIPVRERDMNGAEAIVDNDSPGWDAGYLESGSWTTTSYTGTGYAGTDYRYATTVTGTASATAVWTATLPTEGRYGVYAWYHPGSNRAPGARYTIHHAGGETTVIIDQRKHGLTWRYLGTYGFQAGEEARVTLSNRSSAAGQAVIADAVRFGGGTFDNLTGIQTDATYAPVKPWWEMGSYYYAQRMGMDPDDYPKFNDVIVRPMYARWEHAGTGDDAVYVSWHTNGYSGYQWDFSGTVSYIYNGETKPVTPGSADLQRAIHNEIIQDIRAGWDSEWRDLDKRSWVHGEVRELWDPDLDPSERQIPGALFEIAYHDHPGDIDALKEPAFNMLVARAMYQGIVKYFEGRDEIDLPLLPEPPTHLAVRNVDGGQVRVSWRSSPTDTVELVGDAATGYRVYTSTNGLGWSNGAPVTGTTAYTLTDLPGGELLFVRVTATNEGGESFPTETLATRTGDDAEVLLVNGFDRLDKTMLVPEDDPIEGENVRMFLDRMNRYDYVIQHGEAISYPFDSASNEAVQGDEGAEGQGADGPADLRTGDSRLDDYAVVDWTLGEESASDETLNAAERALLEGFLDGGGALLISGSEIGRHLDDGGADPDFYSAVLRAEYVADDADTHEVIPTNDSIFEGLEPFRFDAPGMYDVDSPDVVTPVNGARAALMYQGGTGGSAALQYADGCERLVYLGFPFETIRPENRPGVMARVLDFSDVWSSAITTPLDGSAHNNVPRLEGMAGQDGVAVQRVEMQIERASDGQYWNEAGWVTETTWLTATGTDVWSYTLPISLTENVYRLRARAWTTECGVDPFPAQVSFIYDPTPIWLPLVRRDF